MYTYSIINYKLAFNKNSSLHVPAQVPNLCLMSTKFGEKKTLYPRTTLLTIFRAKLVKTAAPRVVADAIATFRMLSRDIMMHAHMWERGFSPYWGTRAVVLMCASDLLTKISFNSAQSRKPSAYNYKIVAAVALYQKILRICVGNFLGSHNNTQTHNYNLICTFN